MKKLAPEPEPITLDTQDDIPEEWELSIRDCTVKGTNRRNRLVPIKHCATDRPACHDLNAVLHLISTGKLAVSAKTQQPGVAAIKSVGGLLLGGDFYDKEEHDEDQKIGPIKAFAWPLLVQAGGLAKVSGTRLELSRAGIRALSVPAEKTIKNLWKRWLKTRLLDELNRIDCFKGQKGKGKRGLTAVTGRRAVIDEALRECPPGEWIAIDELFNNMLAGGLDFEDITRRTQSLRDEGTAQLIECVDAALATMIANDTRTRRYCLLAGDRHLVVPAKSETRFRTALRKLGYSLPK